MTVKRSPLQSSQSKLHLLALSDGRPARLFFEPFIGSLFALLARRVLWGLAPFKAVGSVPHHKEAFALHCFNARWK
jgi:hypothetical protein